MLGRHEGIARYTVGQAKRLGLPRIEGEAAPVVTQLDPGNGVASSSVPAMPACGWCRLREVNWLADAPRCRSARHGEAARARGAAGALVRPLRGGAAEVLLDETALPAPGQACVFYQGDRVLGGGFIERPVELRAVGT